MVGIFLGIKSFDLHTSDEGSQLQNGMAFNGFSLCGKGLKYNTSNVEAIINFERVDEEKPEVVILQDEREWNPRNPCCIDKGEEFIGLDILKGIRTLSIIKDAQWFNFSQNGLRSSAEFCEQYGIKEFICYYDTKIVSELSGINQERLIRTYHSIDKVPIFNPERLNRALISGANSSVYYPLRSRLINEHSKIRGLDYLEHPGYGANGSYTPRYLETLNKYKIAVCTASKYQYALRKIIEATACGCIVFTNLQEELPEIDGNLVRINEDISIVEMYKMIKTVKWEEGKQYEFAEKAKAFYDYRQTTKRLSKEILKC